MQCGLGKRQAPCNDPVADFCLSAGFDHGVGHPLLLLGDAKAPNYRKNKAFKNLGHYSAWPKVADAVIEAHQLQANSQRVDSLLTHREIAMSSGPLHAYSTRENGDTPTYPR